MNNVALLTTLLAVLMASANIAVAAADTNEPLLEPLYPENYQEEEERDLRSRPARRDELFATKAAGGGISGTGNVKKSSLRKASPNTEEKLRPARVDEENGGKENVLDVPGLFP